MPDPTKLEPTSVLLPMELESRKGLSIRVKLALAISLLVTVSLAMLSALAHATSGFRQDFGTVTDPRRELLDAGTDGNLFLSMV